MTLNWVKKSYIQLYIVKNTSISENMRIKDLVFFTFIDNKGLPLKTSTMSTTEL
jgi:hypothetical protein